MISVIVPHYRDLRGLDLCLAALGRQTFPADGFEIVVADNGSPEGEAAVAKLIDGRARLVVVPEKGAGLARNGGVAAARGTILAFTDSDCQPEPGWLEAGVAALADHDFVGGAVKVLVADEDRLTAIEAFERVFAFNFERYIRKMRFTGSGNLFCPRELFEAVGGFRTGLSEDVEWSHRAIKLGYTLGYAEEAAVGHPARRTWPELRGKWQRVNAETYGLFVRRPLGRLQWLVRSWALPISAVVHSPRIVTSSKLSTSPQRLAALAVLYRLRLWRFVDAHRLLLRGPKL